MTARGLRAAEAATYVGLSVSGLRNAARSGHLPRPVFIGRRAVWLREDLDAALDRAAGKDTNPGDDFFADSLK